ncbi:hypothetical protein [Halonotius pteroides]|uniref:DUF1102 domain-containing protein n=1 Tax=Halonotius pteroides TaxID=268735 RepID=A0A3A6QGG1_9EURY|nr:hypothetical protein [Halonotius pteroides]RJX51147.1 hypothetical protein DP106_03425 [Halonotius pteroides]
MRLTRRNAVLGLTGVTAGGGAIVGTGAFTSVEAERSVTVTTAGDADAALGMEPLSTPNGDEYAAIDGGTLAITVPTVNLTAVTHIDDVFGVTNNGTQPVVVCLEEQGGEKTAAVDLGARLDQGFSDGSNDVTSVGGGEQPSSDGIADTEIVDLSYPGSPAASRYNDIGILLDVGQSLEVGVYIDTSDANLNDELGESSSVNLNKDQTLLDGVVVHASATAADNDNYYLKRTST